MNKLVIFCSSARVRCSTEQAVLESRSTTTGSPSPSRARPGRPGLTGAALAALCIEHGVAVTADSDFARFPEIDWINPLAS